VDWTPVINPDASWSSSTDLCENVLLLVGVVTELADSDVVGQTDNPVSEVSQLLLTQHVKLLLQYQRLHGTVNTCHQCAAKANS